MTTNTTDAALNAGRESTSDEPSATENAQGAGIEQRETEHVDPAGNGRARADTGDDIGRAHRLVWLAPRGLAVHPHSLAASSGR